MKRIESIKNEKVKHIKKLHTKKGREKSGTFLIEGFHLIEEAIKHDVTILEIIIREGELYNVKFDTTNIEMIEVTNEVMKALSDTETPQGIAAICKMNNANDQQVTPGKYLLIDRVQDPGNLGTMIRTADSAGLDAVILGEGCVDVYNSKVIRSTQGSLFHLPIISGNLIDWVQKLQQQGVPVYGSSLEDSTPYQHTSSKPTFALIMGNEGQGISKELLQETNENLYIPIYGEAESLNVSVACGILLYHLRG